MGINGKIVVRCIQEKYSAETKKQVKRKIYVFAVGMILLFLIGKYSGWSGRLLNGDLTQALQHITVENLPAAIFIYLVGYRSGKC